jgi:hypothetical protein
VPRIRFVLEFDNLLNRLTASSKCQSHRAQSARHDLERVLGKLVWASDTNIVRLTLDHQDDRTTTAVMSGVAACRHPPPASSA